MSSQETIAQSDQLFWTRSAGSMRTQLQCPACGHALVPVTGRDASCDICGFTIVQINGIYRALTSDSWDRLGRFMTEYQKIREQEGRGSDSDEYYLALPFRDVTGHNAWQWSIRVRTYLHFENVILPKITAEHPNGADILDVGAGNGWLSYRLAVQGHHPVAVDLVDNASDGLGAARHYLSHLPVAFPCFQADMDQLPFGSRQFDAVIFNASFHYSVDYENTLKEALRCLRRPGYLVVADSPFYRHAESGEQMVRERCGDFIRKFGFASDSLDSREYLTPGIMADLAHQLHLQWNVEKPWYGIDWALRPMKAWIRKKREPSKFYLFWAKVER